MIQYESRWNNGWLRLATKSNKHMVWSWDWQGQWPLLSWDLCSWHESYREYLHCLFRHRIVHKDSMLSMKWHSLCTEEMETGIDGSCWHCYQNVCVCVRTCVWFKDGSNIPLTSVTSSAHICCFVFYKNSDTVVRATAASRPQPTQHILTLCACESVRAACFNKTTLLRWWQDFESST